ncbi:MAG: hypothetical protein M3Z11_10810 [Candidatus Dormibacteraeota bacterium]|nr:hypothetical protein [Candidatus Dormibacteraeota bacterium]
MAEFEDRLHDAFEDELSRTPAPPGLRQRVILNAVANPRPGTRRVAAPVTRVFAFGGALAAVAAIAVIAGSVGIAIGRNGPAVAQKSPGASPTAAPVAFGKLPPPNLNPPQGLGGGGTAPAIAPYFGPAQMTWAGQLPLVPASAPVYRLQTPGAVEADAFAARLGAKLEPRGSAGNRNYTGPDGFLMGITLGGPQPTFVFFKDPAAKNNVGPTEAVARAAAADFLTRYGLTPTWPYRIVTSSAAPPQQASPFGPPPGFPGFTIDYQRLVPLSNGTFAPEVDVNGEPTGLELMVDPGGQVYRAGGPLPVTEQSGPYPLRAPSSTVAEAIAASPLVPVQGPVPSVALTRSELVYTAVKSGAQTYLEPGYLFGGLFGREGQLSEKRVLVPALAVAVTQP